MKEEGGTAAAEDHLLHLFCPGQDTVIQKKKIFDYFSYNHFDYQQKNVNNAKARKFYYVISYDFGIINNRIPLLAEGFLDIFVKQNGN